MATMLYSGFQLRLNIPCCVYGLENVVLLHFSLWAIQTIKFLYVLHGMLKRTCRSQLYFTQEVWWQLVCHITANLDTLELKCLINLEWHLNYIRETIIYRPQLPCVGRLVMSHHRHAKWINSGAGAPIVASVR